MIACKDTRKRLKRKHGKGFDLQEHRKQEAAISVIKNTILGASIVKDLFQVCVVNCFFKNVMRYMSSCFTSRFECESSIVKTKSMFYLKSYIVLLFLIWITASVEVRC